MTCVTLGGRGAAASGAGAGGVAGARLLPAAAAAVFWPAARASVACFQRSPGPPLQAQPSTGAAPSLQLDFLLFRSRLLEQSCPALPAGGGRGREGRGPPARAARHVRAASREAAPRGVARAAAASTLRSRPACASWHARLPGTKSFGPEPTQRTNLLHGSQASAKLAP